MDSSEQVRNNDGERLVSLWLKQISDLPAHVSDRSGLLYATLLPLPAGPQ